MLMFLSSVALGQSCTEGCVPEALCQPTDSCALQAVPSDDFSGVQWIGNDHTWHANRWWATDVVSDDHPSIYLLQPTSASVTSTNSEQTCAIDYMTGAIHCYGNANANGQITGRPTGSSYTSLAVGNMAAANSTGSVWAALDAPGNIVTWGNVGTGTFATAKPTTSGFDAVAVGFGPVGCAVDSTGAGVNCWGVDTNLIVTNRPTTGTYKAVGIGKTVAGAVSTSGSLTLWGSSSSLNFRNTWSGATDVSEVFFTEVGDQVGVAYHTDGTITIWQNPSVSRVPAIANVPCKPLVDCPGTATKVYRTAIQFRTAPRLTKADQPASICGVVKYDPDSNYSCGDVICWGHYGQTGGVPVLIQECADPTGCF